MRERLLDGSEGLYLQRTRSEQPCVVTDDRIPKGDHAVSVRQELETSSYLVWVSLGSVDELASQLATFDPDEHDPHDEYVLIEETGWVKYHRTTGRKQVCGVCERKMEQGDEGISFYAPASQSPDMVWIHPGCAGRLAEGLERVWEFDDELLPEAV